MRTMWLAGILAVSGAVFPMAGARGQAARIPLASANDVLLTMYEQQF